MEMVSGKIKFNRVLIVIILALLALQFEFGMAVNLGPNLPELAPFGFSLTGIVDALRMVGFAALVHALLGGLLAILAVIILFVSMTSGMRSAQIFGSLGFLAIVLAAVSGLLFVLSGFQNDGYSHGMATNFILAFVFYFLELYALKPVTDRNT